MYFLAILLPPLAILLSGRPFQAIFNAVLWLAGLVLMILPFVPGLLTWAIAAVWAVMVVNSEKQAERDRRLVETALERDRSRRVR
jgi:Mg2+/citrate symporter